MLNGASDSTLPFRNYSNQNSKSESSILYFRDQPISTHYLRSKIIIGGELLIQILQVLCIIARLRETNFIIQCQFLIVKNELTIFVHIGVRTMHQDVWIIGTKCQMLSKLLDSHFIESVLQNSSKIIRMCSKIGQLLKMGMLTSNLWQCLRTFCRSPKLW